MIEAIALGLFHGFVGPVDRVHFSESFRRIKVGDDAAKVERALGQPNRTRLSEPPDGLPSRRLQIWCYGCSTGSSMPTLGQVWFQAGHVQKLFGNTGSPPSSHLISEAELRQHLERLYRGVNSMPAGQEDPIRIVRMVNDLIPLGKPKAIAVLNEFDRVSPAADANYSYWLSRILFKYQTPESIFPVPRIGAINPAPPLNLKGWPTYPVSVIDDVPILFEWGILPVGPREPFGTYSDRYSARWTLRSKPLRPPDDPFPIVQKLAGIALHYVPGVHSFFSGVRLLPSAFQLHALIQLRTSLHSVCPFRPIEANDSAMAETDCVQSHRAFLAQHLKWDTAAQAYVSSKKTVKRSGPTNVH